MSSVLELTSPNSHSLAWRCSMKLFQSKNRIFGLPLLFALFLLVCSIPNFVTAAQPMELETITCPTPEESALTVEEKRAKLHTWLVEATTADVLVGVDVLGRVAIAVDLDQDTIVDRVMMYTDTTRLDGPWSKLLSNAHIAIQDGAILITSREYSFGMSLAVSVAVPQTIPNWVDNPTVHSGGRELVQLWDNLDSVHMADLNHSDVSSWPESLHMDLLEETPTGSPLLSGGCSRTCCDDGPCTSGGPPSTSCSIGGCSGTPSSCNVSGCDMGLMPPTFACCGCGLDGQGGIARCRCKSCSCGPCP